MGLPYEVPEIPLAQLIATPNDPVRDGLSDDGHGDEGVGGRGSSVGVERDSRGMFYKHAKSHVIFPPEETAACAVVTSRNGGCDRCGWFLQQLTDLPPPPPRSILILALRHTPSAWSV